MKNIYIINTNFIHIKDIVLYISNPMFFVKIIQTINPLAYEYEPKLNFITNKVAWPQIIKYEESPKIGSFLLPKLQIIQTWDIKHNNLIGNIQIFHKNKHLATISLLGIFIKDMYIRIKLKADWLYKIPFIPESILPGIMTELENTFNKILNN